MTNNFHTFRSQLDVRHLNLVLSISAAGTISRAAEHLNLTQSALSHQLRDIEQKLGVPLFLRLKKRMVPTAAGERLLLSAEKVLTELSVIEEAVRQFGSDHAGNLRISTECYTCYHWLPAVLKTFGERYPGVSIQIVAESTRKPLTALLEGRIDLAIVSSRIENKMLVSEALFEDELVAVVQPSHPFASKKFLTPADFTGEHIFTYTLPLTEIAFFRKILLPNGIEPRQVSQVELTEAIIEMVKAGLGIAVLANWAVRPLTENGTLRAVPITRQGLSRTWHAVTRKSPNPPKYWVDFVDLLKSGLQGRN